jgi:hypothetical protein
VLIRGVPARVARVVRRETIVCSAENTFSQGVRSCLLFKFLPCARRASSHFLGQIAGKKLLLSA